MKLITFKVHDQDKIVAIRPSAVQGLGQVSDTETNLIFIHGTVTVVGTIQEVATKLSLTIEGDTDATLGT